MEQASKVTWVTRVRAWIKKLRTGTDDYGRRLIDGYGLER